MFARTIFGVSILLVLVGAYLLWLDLDIFLAVDTCLDQGGSFNYSIDECDFSVSHPYVPRQSHILWGISCLVVGTGGIVWARRKLVPNAP